MNKLMLSWKSSRFTHIYRLLIPHSYIKCGAFVIKGLLKTFDRLYVLMKKMILFSGLAALICAYCLWRWEVCSFTFSEPVAMLVFGLALGGAAKGLRRNYRAAEIHATEG